MTTFAGYEIDWLGSYRCGFEVKSLKDAGPAAAPTPNGTPSVGMSLTAGTWNGAPLSWRVIATKGYLALVLCEDVVRMMPLRGPAAPAGNMHWLESDVRSWLLHEFLPQALPEAEQHRLGFGLNRTRLESTSFDPVFCLSQDEYEAFLPEGKEFRCASLLKGCGKGASLLQRLGMGSQSVDWWLRDPGEPARVVTKRGCVNARFGAMKLAGVRPAMTISL